MTPREIENEITRLRLELIDVNTRLEGMGPLSKGYADLEQKRIIIANQIQYLESQRSAPSPVTLKQPKTKGPTQSEIVQEKVNKLKGENPDRTIDEIFDQVAEEMGKTVVAIRASYYRKLKTKKSE